jgi:hypothetical protein
MTKLTEKLRHLVPAPRADHHESESDSHTPTGNELRNSFGNRLSRKEVPLDTLMEIINTAPDDGDTSWRLAAENDLLRIRADQMDDETEEQLKERIRQEAIELGISDRLEEPTIGDCLLLGQSWDSADRDEEVGIVLAYAAAAMKDKANGEIISASLQRALEKDVSFHQAHHYTMNHLKNLTPPEDIDSIRAA